ncbi:MAG TPA: hypothetical protein VIP51_08710 [Eoetvoesiella sp.]
MTTTGRNTPLEKAPQQGADSEVFKILKTTRHRRTTLVRLLKLIASLQTLMRELQAENRELENIIHAQALRIEELQNAKRD